MRKSLIASSLALLTLCLFTLAAADKDKSMSMAGPKVGDMAPAFSLQDQDGKTVSLADFKDKVVVLEWFNNECPFVQKHYKTGHMNTLASGYADKGVVWVAINSTSGKTSSDNKAIATEWKMERPVLSDADGTVGHEYGSKNTPTMYIVDKDGKVAYRGAIDNKADPDSDSISSSTNYVSKALDEMLAGKPVSEPMTKAYGCSVKYAK